MRNILYAINLARLAVAMLASALLAFLSTADISFASPSSAYPTHIYTRDDSGALKEYALVDAGPGRGGAQSYTLSSTTGTDPLWIVELCSGVADEDGRLIQPKMRVTSDMLDKRDGELYYVPAEMVDVNGTAYYRTQEAVRVNPSGGVVEAFYTPRGYEPTDDYVLTLRYADIAAPDEAPIEEQSYVMSAEQSGDGAIQAIAVPVSISGGTYVLVPGQLFEESTTAGCMDLEHSYYAPERSYTIYYRNVNDADHLNTVITRIDAVYAEEASGAAATAGQTIEDDANPLAAPGSHASVATSSVKSTVLGGLITGLVVGGCLMFVYFIYKKRTEDRVFGGDSYI